MRSTHQNHIEYEITLLICSESSDQIFNEISKLKFILEYRLAFEGRRLIKDIYYDTQDQLLSKRKWALRIRIIDSQRLITVKGPTNVDQNSPERLELEEFLSFTALKKIQQLFSRHQIAVNLPKSLDILEKNPLANSGLEIIQQRSTARAIWGVYTDVEERVAELVLDKVQFHLQEKNVIHNEIEIESLKAGGEQAGQKIADYLLAKYGSALKRWDFGKLATGIALQKLFATYPAADLLSQENHLKSEAYQRIAAILEMH